MVFEVRWYNQKYKERFKKKVNDLKSKLDDREYVKRAAKSAATDEHTHDQHDRRMKLFKVVKRGLLKHKFKKIIQPDNQPSKSL